ncbi:MAG: tRNA glutamyl-Q(34) synthetase GluQRS [Stagnimonas sp.]|nr:tRNA glutamyl-Q(34) synthetase GluQRS [Stagnimonas sp.]
MIVISITPPYRGRFAPTPSGPLHLGSLFTALASWLAARQAGGTWHLRIDDLDRPRCMPGAEDTILRQLEAHGLHWDGAPVRQTEHTAQYQAALHTLGRQGQLYACTCTRAVLAATALPGPDGAIYPGTCRSHITVADKPATLRLRVLDGILQWQDGIQGRTSRAIPAEAGDFVVRRADGQIGYHLACALDEHRMGITEVVRGADLLGATVNQLSLFKALDLTAPGYAHVPVLLESDGRKLSKQNGAAALATGRAGVSQQLLFCLTAMRLAPPPQLAEASAETILHWALQHWHPQHFASTTTLPIADLALP